MNNDTGREKKTFLDFAAQVFLLFGVMILIMACICLLLGEDVREISSMFRLGSEGLPLSFIAQLLSFSVIVVSLNLLFFSETVLKDLSATLRILFCMLGIVLTAVAYIFLFRWFPPDIWQAWVMFFVLFFIFATISFLVTYLKLKQENKKMAELLTKLQNNLKEENHEPQDIH